MLVDSWLASRGYRLQRLGQSHHALGGPLALSTVSRTKGADVKGAARFRLRRGFGGQVGRDDNDGEATEVGGEAKIPPLRGAGRRFGRDDILRGVGFVGQAGRQTATG